MDNETHRQNRVDLVKLRHFVAVAQLESFARAAEQLHISQPGLSRSIQSLERAHSVRLFHRDRSGVELTAAGRMLLPRAVDLILSSDALELDIESVSRGAAGTLSFGVGGGALGSVLPEVVSHLLTEFPRVEVSVTIGSYRELAPRLAAGHDEFFLSRAGSWSSADRIEVETLGGGRTTLFVRPGHPLLEEGEIDLERLADFPLMATSEWNGVVAALPHRRERDLLRAQVTVNEQSPLVAMTHHSDGIMVSSNHAQRRGLVPLVIRGNTFDSPLMSRSGGIFTLPHRTLSAAARAAIDVIRSSTQRYTE